MVYFYSACIGVLICAPHSLLHILLSFSLLSASLQGSNWRSEAGRTRASPLLISPPTWLSFLQTS